VGLRLIRPNSAVDLFVALDTKNLCVPMQERGNEDSFNLETSVESLAVKAGQASVSRIKMQLQ
jgi:hypothetical protein